MSGRLASSIAASALIRRVHDQGGFAAVRAKGDEQVGAFLLIAVRREGGARVYERGLGPTGEPTMIDSTPADLSPERIELYWRKRRARDPDLWVIELDIPGAERFAAETLA